MFSRQCELFGKQHSAKCMFNTREWILYIYNLHERKFDSRRIKYADKCLLKSIIRPVCERCMCFWIGCRFGKR